MAKFNHRGVEAEIVKREGGYRIIAGYKREVSSKVFKTHNEAQRFFEYNLNRALDYGRYPRVEGFPGKLDIRG